MSSHGEPASDNRASAGDDSTYDDMPALTPVPAGGIPNTTSRRRRRNNNPQAQDGSDSDASMPSLQTVSDSSDDEAYGQSASEWETESEDSEDEEDEEYPEPESAWYEPIPPPDHPPAYTGFIEEIRRRRNAGRATPPTPPSAAGPGGRPADAPGVPNSQVRFNAFQTQMRNMVESFAAIANTATGPLLPEDFGVFQDIGNLNLAQLLNPYTEVEDDPDRAKTIMEKLEVVPNELVSRYEKLRSGIREGMEDVDGCAICRDSFLADGQVMDEVLVGQAMVDAVISSDALPGKETTQQTSPSNQASTSSQSSIPAESSQKAPKILVFPCPGMHLFHADCLAPWLSRKTTCPSCRYDVDPHSLTLRLDRFAPRFDENHALRAFGSPRFTLAPGEPPSTSREPAPSEDRPPSPRIPGWFEETFTVVPAPLEEQPAGRRDVEVDATQAPPSNNVPDRPPRPTRRLWKPPKGRDFRRWLDREEKKKDGIEVEDENDADESEPDDDLPLDDSPPRFARAPQIVQDAVRQFVGDIGIQLGHPPVPPPVATPPVPAAIPAIPPWEEGEFPGSNASAFVGARRAAAVGGVPRPSPLRFEAIAHPVDDNPYYNEEDEEDEEEDDDASSMPELGVPEQVDFQQLMRALRGRESTIPSTSSEFGSSRGVDASEDEDEDDDDDDDELPPLIPDTIGRPPAAAAPPASSSSNSGQNVNRDSPARQRFADRLPRLFQGYFQPQSGSLGLRTGSNASQPSQVSESSVNPGLGPRRSSLDDVDD